jgi:hypothetical protein
MLMPSDHEAEYLKAKCFSEEPFRFTLVDRDTFVWKGSSCAHLLVCVEGTWHCDCAYGGQSHLPCGHLRALEQLLSDSSFCPDCPTRDTAEPSSLEPGPGEYNHRNGVELLSASPHMSGR